MEDDITEEEFLQMFGEPLEKEEPPKSLRDMVGPDCDIIGIRPSEPGEEGVNRNIEDLEDGDVIGDNDTISLF